MIHVDYCVKVSAWYSISTACKDNSIIHFLMRLVMCHVIFSSSWSQIRLRKYNDKNRKNSLFLRFGLVCFRRVRTMTDFWIESISRITGRNTGKSIRGAGGRLSLLPSSRWTKKHKTPLPHYNNTGRQREYNFNIKLDG